MSNLSKTVLLTGASGFLGSHIAEALVANNFNVIATKRSSSDLWRCDTYKEQIIWLNSDQPNWQKEVIKLCPQLIIHSAWMGVSAADRMSWESQLTNISLVQELLEIADQVKPKIFIGFGSQAEYGTFEGKVSETYPTNPNTAYGTVKLMIYEFLKGFFNTVPVDITRWYWLRLFSFYGEREDNTWLVPSTIQKLLRNETIQFTKGEQKYAYLYVKDLAQMLIQLINANAASGVYNISSTHPVSIKNLIEKISTIIGSKSELNFGVLPYRQGQTMHMEGDMSKFEKEMGEFVESDWSIALNAVVRFFSSK